jgi:hypothetical protein
MPPAALAQERLAPLLRVRQSPALIDLLADVSQ